VLYIHELSCFMLIDLSTLGCLNCLRFSLVRTSIPQSHPVKWSDIKFLILNLLMRNFKHWIHSLMFVPCSIRHSRNNHTMHWIVPLFYSIYWLLHVSAVVCHHQGVCGSICCAFQHNRQNHNTPAHRPHNHTLYDIPPIRSVFQVTQTDPRSSLMMAGYCQNM
jgi:hypothetical protein